MSGNKKLNIALSVLSFCLVCLVGIGIIGWQADTSLKKDTQNRLAMATTRIDAILLHAEQAAKEAEPLLGARCTPEVLTSIRKMVANIPDVRSVNLYKDNEIYCTSVFGEQKTRIDFSNDMAGELYLMQGNNVTPYRSLIVFHSADRRNSGSLVGIDGYYLSNILKMLSVMAPLHMQVAGNTINGEGYINEGGRSGRVLSRASQDFPYTVYADIESLPIWTAVYRYDRASIAMLVLLSLALSLLISRYLVLRGTIEFQLRKAVRKKQFVAMIQPIVDAKTFRIVGGEVLIRWAHPKRGTIAPDLFIPVAEKTGIIRAITTETFESVAKDFVQSGSHIQHPLFLSFNVCRENFLSDEIVHSCRQFARTVSHLPLQILLEITERDAIEESIETEQIIRQLKDMDVQLSLDDFGTGNANYSYVQRFKPEYIKIDKAFTQRIVTESASEIFINNIIHLAHSFHSQTIGEGVESEKQAEKLRQSGVNYLQGYYISRPVAVEVFIDMLRSHTKRPEIKSDVVQIK